MDRPSSLSLRCRLSGNALKIIAMLSMLVDHIGSYLLPHLTVLRVIGRLAFPIFAYMIAEGCRHTGSRPRYFAKVAALGVACQIVATAVTGTLRQGILLTFSASILAVICLETIHQNKRARCRIPAVAVLLALTFAVAIAPILFRESGFVFDYGAPGALLPVLLYILTDKRAKLLCTALLLAVIAIPSGTISLFSLASLPLLALYSGERGKMNLKGLFYLFYPLHLAVIYLIGYFLSAP